jgi:RNA polymerase sigma-70 factor, ECF subfamily
MTAIALAPTRTGPPALRLVRPGEPQLRSTADSEAMWQVWLQHNFVLQQYALKLTRGDMQRAEDIVQESLVRAWRHPEVIGNGQQPIRSWLFTVARNVATDMWRARSRAEEALGEENTDLPDPAEHMDQVITAVDVRDALSTLIPEHRQVIVEMYLRDRSVAQTADLLGISEGTVKSRAYYGLRRLRQVLAAAPGDVSPAPAAPARRAAHRLAATA